MSKEQTIDNFSLAATPNVQQIRMTWHNDFVSILFGKGLLDTVCVDLKRYIRELGFGSSLTDGATRDGTLVLSLQNQAMENRGNYLALWVLVYLTTSGWMPSSYEKNMPHSILLSRNSNIRH